MRRKPILLMTDDEQRQYTIEMCQMLALKDFKKNNPQATSADATQFINRNWRQFKEQALTAVAIIAASEEQSN